MFVARSGPTGWLLHASNAIPELAPFYCPDTGEKVYFKQGPKVAAHFAYENKVYGESESEGEKHKRIINEIVNGLRCAGFLAEKEKRLNGIRCDIYTVINNTPIGIEIQHSSLSVATLLERTKRYKENGVAVLWISITDNNSSQICTPRIWETALWEMYGATMFKWAGDCYVRPFRYLTGYKPISLRKQLKGEFDLIPYKDKKIYHEMKCDIPLYMFVAEKTNYKGVELLLAKPNAPICWTKHDRVFI